MSTQSLVPLPRPQPVAVGSYEPASSPLYRVRMRFDAVPTIDVDGPDAGGVSQIVRTAGGIVGVVCLAAIALRSPRRRGRPARRSR